MKEIFLHLKKENSEKTGFSSFCALRPKECVTVGSSGAHSVCVCTIYQNVKVMVAAINHNGYYRDLLSLTVCDILSGDCMLHGCETSPGMVPLMNFLEGDIKERYHSCNTIYFKQWVSTDRSQHETRELEVGEFLDELSELTAKNALKFDGCAIVLDFAENYSFVVQDDVQGFHWNNSQVTLHPFVIYFKNLATDALNNMSLVCIS